MIIFMYFNGGFPIKIFFSSCLASRKMCPLCLPITMFYETHINACIWWNESVSIQRTLFLVTGFNNFKQVIRGQTNYSIISNVWIFNRQSHLYLLSFLMYWFLTEQMLNEMWWRYRVFGVEKKEQNIHQHELCESH